VSSAVVSARGVEALLAPRRATAPLRGRRRYLRVRKPAPSRPRALVPGIRQDRAWSLRSPLPPRRNRLALRAKWSRSSSVPLGIPGDPPWPGTPGPSASCRRLRRATSGPILGAGSSPTHATSMSVVPPGADRSHLSTCPRNLSPPSRLSAPLLSGSSSGNQAGRCE
jgi:hypothetical protein